MSKHSSEIEARSYMFSRQTSVESSLEEMPPVSKSYLFTKRLIDVVGALFGLIITSPLFMIIAIMYLFGDSKGPLFFTQYRHGKNGKLFSIYKFRSMIVDADRKLKENQVLYQKYIDNNYKLEPHEDPRITKFGAFLRKTSLDELPQLINVLKGDMSLVGPRPIVDEELLEYGALKDHFLSVKPGITGYWQVSGRSDVGYPDRVDLELYYVYNQSTHMDIKIIFFTVYMVIVRRGAY